MTVKTIYLLFESTLDDVKLKHATFAISNMPTIERTLAKARDCANSSRYRDYFYKYRKSNRSNLSVSWYMFSMLLLSSQKYKRMIYDKENNEINLFSNIPPY